MDQIERSANKEKIDTKQRPSIILPFGYNVRASWRARRRT